MARGKFAPARDSAAYRVRALDVRLGGRIVGSLTNVGGDAILFAFDPAYAADPARPTLSLGFKTADGGLLEQTRPTRVRVPPFFSNLLPEGHLRGYLAGLGGVHPDREFYLLWLAGSDLPGAVEVVSPDGLPPKPEPERRAGGTTRRAKPLRFSLAGVQLKFSAVAQGSKGLRLPVNGVGGDWIVKLPSPRFDAVPENEFAMMTLARAAGIDVPDVRLVPTESVAGLPDLPEAFGTSLAVRRFDRPGDGTRVHIEDFAQVFGVYPAAKYETASYASLARVLWRESGEAAVTEFARRLAFNVLIGNADAHLKNWSLIYRDGRTPALAPAYDLVSTVPYLPQDRLALSLGGTKVFADVDLDRFRRFATQAGVADRLVVQAVKATATAVRDLWPSHEPLRGLSKKTRAAVEKHMAAVRL